MRPFLTPTPAATPAAAATHAFTPASRTVPQTFFQIPRSGISAGLLDPLLVVTYNERLPGRPIGCNDDNLGLRQWVQGYGDRLPGHDALRSVGLSAVTCANLDLIANICDEERAPRLQPERRAGQRHHAADTCDLEPITPLVRTHCPRTCAAYCPRSNHSVVSEALFGETQRFRSQLIETLGLPPRAIRTIASLPPSQGSTALSAAEAWRLLGGDASGRRERLVRSSPYQAHSEPLQPTGTTACDGGLGFTSDRSIRTRRTSSGW